MDMTEQDADASLQLADLGQSTPEHVARACRQGQGWFQQCSMTSGNRGQTSATRTSHLHCMLQPQDGPMHLITAATCRSPLPSPPCQPHSRLQPPTCHNLHKVS